MTAPDEPTVVVTDRVAHSSGGDGTPPRGPARRRPGRALGAILLGLLLVAAGMFVAVSGDEGDGDAPPAARPGAPEVRSTDEPASAAAVDGRPFLASREELRAAADRAAAGREPWASAVAELKKEAEEALQRTPSPANPLRVSGTEGDFVDDSADAYTLALAYVITDDASFAEASANRIRAWSTVATRAEDTCTSDGSCNTTLVISRVGPAFVFAADLLSTSDALSPEDIVAFRRWIRHVVLPAASERTNNWGDAGTFLRITATSYLGDGAGFAAAIETWREQLDLVGADGEIPEETRRGAEGLKYSQEALLYKVASARIAERRGVDLWTYQGASGGTVEKALDLVAASLRDPGGWEWHDDVDVPSPAPMWELALARWNKPAYRAIVADGRPFGPEGHSAIRWTTLAGSHPSA
jgi:hypothetical protein